MTRREWCAAAGAVGLYALTRGLRVALFPPFVDEGIYARWTQTVHDDPHQRFVALANGKEPLLTWAGAAVMDTGAGPLLAQRIVSTVAGLVTMLAVALIARELAGRRAALLAALLYAAIPFFVVHDGIGIMEPLLAAATTAALYLQIRLAREPRLATGLVLGVALAAALLTKASAVYALLLLPAGLLVLDRERDGLGRRVGSWLAANVVALAAAGLG
jgi:4-amino-4-deoxy-L-arabinose transferase-like glycosyltransferase